MRPLVSLFFVLTSALFSSGAGELFHFGKKIGVLGFVERKDYEQKELGYSLRYESKDLLKANIYIYDLGITNLPEGIASQQVRKEMESVKAVVRQFEKSGYYRNVKELGGGERKFQNLKTRFLWARYSYQQSAGDTGAPTEGRITDAVTGRRIPDSSFNATRISDAFLLAKRGKFLKIRITTIQGDFAERERQIDQFMQEVARQLEEAEPGRSASRSQPVGTEPDRKSAAADSGS